MKRIIALWHSGDKGKTKTLTALGNLLLSEISTDKDIIICDKSVKKNKKLPQDTDFTLVVKISDKTIGIESEGDPNSGLKDRLQNMIDNYKPDYLFCATRTRGETVGDVYNISDSTNYEILWTSTYHSENTAKDNIDFFNNLKAKHLFDLLKELIKQEN